MKDWTEGYMAAIDYTHGFYRELTPSILAVAALSKGVRAPSQDEDLNYCEIGCGHGLSTNVLAAANPHIQFYANDFNPTQIAGASRLARESGADNVHFYDSSFEEFISVSDLPESFDIISLHGIYSWVSKENRTQILEFILKKLRPGGLVYISYNTLPGWASAMPLRQLMAEHNNSNNGAILDRVDAAMRYAQRLRSVKAQYFVDQPGLDRHLSNMEGLSKKYISHEYFNRHWTPFYFSEVASELESAKLSFVASAHIMDHIDNINLTREQLDLLAEETDPVRKQSVRDILVNQQFRRDIFLKGVDSYSVLEAHSAWLDLRLVLASRREDVPMTITTRLGEVGLQGDIYNPILDEFAKGPLKVRDLFQNSLIADMGWAKLQQALTLLIANGRLEYCLSPKNIKKRRERTKSFNAAILRRAEINGDFEFLASPVTGGGVHLGRIEQLFLKEYLSGNKETAELANFAWSKLKLLNQKLQKDGKNIESEADSIVELKRQADDFKEKRLPTLISLQIA